MTRILLKNCRLIPELSNGFGKEYADVLFENGRIEKIAAAGSCTMKADREMECGGKTLLPGLFDIHTHLNWDYYLGKIRLTESSLLISSCLSAKRFLDFGITTIRDMGSPRRLSVSVRDAIRRGLFDGPRIVSGGVILCPLNRDKPASPDCFLRHVSGRDEMIRAAREEIGGGADFVKIYLTGNPPDMLPEEAEAACMIAHRYHKRAAAHAHDREAIHLALSCGADTIEHGSYISAEDIEELKKEKSYLVPTLSVLSPLVMEPGFTAEDKKIFLKPILDANAENITAAYRAGLKLGFGTDTPIESFSDETAGLEFRMRTEYCGMKPIDLLLQATVYSALICGVEKETGKLAEGLAADAILVDGKPEEDISVMYRKPEKVFLSGKEVR